MFTVKISSQNFADEFSLPPGPAHDFEKACRSMFILQNQVATHFLEEGMQYFDVTSKSHFVQHLSMLAPHVSPRLIWGVSRRRLNEEITNTCTKLHQGKQPGSNQFEDVQALQGGAASAFLCSRPRLKKSMKKCFGQ